MAGLTMVAFVKIDQISPAIIVSPKVVYARTDLGISGLWAGGLEG